MELSMQESGTAQCMLLVCLACGDASSATKDAWSLSTAGDHAQQQPTMCAEEVPFEAGQHSSPSIREATNDERCSYGLRTG